MKTFKHLFTALLLLCCITASAHDFEVDGIYYKITDESNKTVSVTYEGSSYNYQPEYNEYTGDVVLQPTVMYGGNTYNVTGIADNAFEYCANLQSVTIPSSIKSIGYRSFENCLSLQTVNLSEGLTSIGVCAFQYCTKLTAIVIPSSVTTISNYAFRDCPKLESVTFCAQVAPTVSTDVFTRISSTAVLKYPAGSDYSPWSGYFAKTEEFAATIGGSCGANVNWTLENGVLTITGNGAMDDYTDPWMEYAALITNVVIEDGVTKIGESAFSGCSALTSIVIPNSVTHVGQQAFDRCTALESVTIGSGVKSGFFLAFNGCSKLTSITSLIPAEDIFGITGDPGDSYWGLSDKERCTLYVPYGAKATYAKTAPWSEFANIVELEPEVIGGSCGANVNWTLEGDVLTISGSGNMDDYSSDATPWNKYKWDIKTVIIESGVTSIGNYAFQDCDGLTSITIPNSVTSIGVGAFSLCNSLTNVTMPDGITTIRPLTFADCNSLGSITIPNGVTHVDGGAFLHCTSLVGIEIPASVTAIDKEAFMGCSHLSKVVSWATAAPTLGEGVFANIDPSATLHYPAGSDYSAWRGSFASTKEFTKVSYQVISESDKTAKVVAATNKYTGDVVIPAVIDGYTITGIGEKAFYNCSSLTSIRIPSSVTNIGNYAFSGSTSLKDLRFEDGEGILTLGHGDSGGYGYYGLFNGCPLETIYIGRDLSYDASNNKGYSPFYNIKTLTSLTIGNSVTNIGDYAFFGCSGLAGKLVIPDGVTSIGKWAFRGCGALTLMTIGNGVASIGDYAFQDCNGLTGELVIPDAVTSIGNHAFELCSSLTGFVIGNSVTSIGTDAFSGCSGLASMTIGRNVTNIGNYAFNGCRSLKNLRFEDAEGALTLGKSGSDYNSYGMFRDCPLETLYIGRKLSYDNNKDYYSPFYNIKTLTSLTIGNSVTNIGNYAFYGCTGLTGELVIPNSVTSIGYSAFNGCSGLSSLTLGNGLTAINSSAFYGCIGLTGEFVIPNSVTTIGYSAFSGCSGLSSLTIGSGVTSIGSSAFNGCTSFKDLRIEDGEGVITNTDKLFKDSPLETLYLGRDLSYSNPNSPFYNKTSLKSVTIGDCVTTIGYSAFSGCTGLTGELVIPNSVTNILSGAFDNCTSLKKVRFEDGKDVLYMGRSNSSSVKGMFYDSPLEYLYLGRDIDYTSTNNATPFRDIITLTELVISNSVTNIGDYAFYGCTGLTGELVIPNSVTSIGSFAFKNCSGLSSLTLGNGVTTIGSSAFSGCIGLTGELIIPNSVTSIDSYAFSGCSGLTGKLIIPNSVTSIGSSAFDKCSGLSSLTLGNGVTTIGSSAFSGCIGLTGELVIPNSVTSIGSYAFSGCSGLTGKLVIPNSVTSIDSYAFSGCSGLTGKLVIPNSVTSIGSSVFYNCSGLSSLTLGNGLTTIGSGTFYGCSALKEVHISDIGAWCGIGFGDSSHANPLSWAKNLYLNGELVTELVIPEGVTEVKAYAFVGYDKLLNVTIPSSVTKIGSSAFNGAKAVFDIAAEEPSTIGSGAFHSNAVLAVPDAVVDAYKAAWSGYAAQITGKSEAFVCVDVKAMDATSGIMERVGIDKMSSIAKLTVKGSINSYDVIQFRDKMPLLRELDLSEATVVASNKAFYNGNCTKDNDLGGYAFYKMSKLNYVKLPKDLIAVGACSFFGCSSLREMVVPETVQSIGESAFYICTSLKNIELPKEMVSIGDYAFYQCSSLGEIIIPIGVKSTGRFVFDLCSSLERVTLPNGLESIGSAAFRGCTALNEIKMPPTVQFLGGAAFYNCSSLEEIRIPSSVTSIGESAFGGCSNLAKVYTYTVEPTAIQENTFSTFQTATLYVPSFSFSNYYWDDGWKRFLNLAEFNEPYEYFYVNNDYVLNDDTGYIEGVEGENPDADINAGGGIIIEGEQGDDEIPNQSLGDVNVGCDGNGTSGSIIGDNNLHIDDLHIKINVKGSRWYFFAFPFDIQLDRISMENGSDYVFRYYDGAERAQNGKGGWKDINENHLKAARGYIFQCSANDVLVLNIEDVKFKKEDKYNELVAHVSDNLKDASWNFTGNPYLSYYDMADMDYTAPVTVWDGSKYVAIRPGDDDYHFAPYEAFFVQKPEGQEAIGFDGEEQMTKNQSNKQKEKQAAARRARGIDPERLLINLVLGNGTSDDRTRIVFNERQSLGYETSCDATKFSTSGVTQLYTIGSDKVHYAINERPADNGRVVLGYTAPTAGFYTIEAQRMDAEVYVKDFKTGTLHNLKDGAYSFGTDAGTFNDRFEILLKGTAPGTTGIDELKGENGKVKTENGEVKTEIYDLQGRKMQDAEKGIYIINGEKVVK